MNENIVEKKPEKKGKFAIYLVIAIGLVILYFYFMLFAFPTVSLASDVIVLIVITFIVLSCFLLSRKKENEPVLKNPDQKLSAPPTQLPSLVKKCPKCGFEVFRSMKKCPNCGRANTSYFSY